MKIIRWLFSHIILILLIVVVIYGYMFWGRLTDADTPGGKAIAYLSDKFVPAEESVNETETKQAELTDQQSSDSDEKNDDEQSIVAGMNAGEVSREDYVAGSTVEAVESTAENNLNATGEAVADESGMSMTDGQREVPVNTPQLTFADATDRAGVTEMNKDTFVSPEIEEQLGKVGNDGAMLGANDVSPSTDQQGEASVDDAPSTIGDAVTSAGGSAVETIKNIFVSSDTEEQLEKDDTTVAADEALSSTGQQGETTVDDEPLTIGDAIASAGASAVETVKDMFVSPDVEEKINNVAAEEIVAANQNNTDKQNINEQNPSEKNPDVRASWITARKSYYQRNYELSEKSYQQVIDNTEDNYDAYGELGNVYFNQGKNKQAAAAYYGAAAIFVRTGNLSRARSLIGLLRRLDRSKADELQQLIDTESS